MIRLILPVLLAVLGVAAGSGAGYVLRPAEMDAKDAAAQKTHTDEEEASKDKATDKKADKHSKGASSESEFVKLNNQFVIPIVSGTLVEALVVMSLSLEVAPGASQSVYSMEPKLRDAFLQVMFDHANIGGFTGVFTQASTLEVLRSQLTETAHRIIGDDLESVLIVDLVRQDV